MAHITTIQFYRGAEAGIPTLAAGEPGFTTDSYKLFIGDGATNHEIGGGSSYTDENAQDAVGGIFADTATIDITYTDGTPEIKADVKTNSIDVTLMHAGATNVLFGRSSSGAGAGEEIACTAAGRAILDDADAAAQRTTLGLGSAALSATGAFDAAGAAAAAQAASQPLDATLTALAGANWAANSLAIGSGSDTVAQVTFAANTFPARASTGDLVAKPLSDFALTILDDVDAAAVRATIGATAGVTDHGALTGLGDDDHTQYALLAGRASGQTQTGGTASAESLTLQSTSHATKGGVKLAADDWFDLDEITAPSIAASGRLRLFAKAGGRLGTVDDDGLESWMQAWRWDERDSAASATFTAGTVSSTLYWCDAATASMTVTLPDATGNTGMRVGFKLKSTASARTLTIDGDGADTIELDGVFTTTLVLYLAGDYLELVSNGVNWVVTVNSRQQHYCKLTRSGTAQTVTSSGSFVKVTVNTSISDTAAIGDTTNSKITAKIAGKYLVSVKIFADGNLGLTDYLVAAIFVNGTNVSATGLAILGSAYGGANLTDVVTLAAGDYVEFYVASSDASFTTRLDAEHVKATLILVGPLK